LCYYALSLSPQRNLLLKARLLQNTLFTAPAEESSGGVMPYLNPGLRAELLTDGMVLSCCLNRVFQQPMGRFAATRPSGNAECFGIPPLAVGIQNIMTTPNAAHSGTVSIAGDLTVNRLGYGAMRITGEGIWGDPKKPAECKRVLKRLLDLNVNFIDTADAYGPEVSENLIAEALHPYPKGLVIATKGGLTRQGPNQWIPVGRAEYLRQCVEMSLRRLRVERIDLYQLHRFDPKVPVEESLGELKKMQQEGKIRHIGLSETTVADIQRAQKIVTVVSVQNKYNITDRIYEDVVEYCEKNKIAFIPWFPLAAGELTKPGGALDKIAHAHKATTSQVAIAWLLRRSPVMLPIPGTSKVKHLEENVATADLKLSEAEWQSLEEAARKAA
jgi:pyridoxine 4-dehydrogenase